MKIRFDEKGKYFTELVAKTSLIAKIVTNSHQIVGTVYLNPGNRLLDELNDSPSFIAVTDAQIDNDAAVDFVALNVDQIMWIVPIEENLGDEDNDR